MADNKTPLTDAEIKQNLKFIAKYCKSEYNEIRVDELLLNAIDLVNRLEADKEALIAGQETLQKALAEKNAELERLNIYIEQYKKSIEGLKTITKSEAIKEFAERLKKQSFTALHHKMVLSNDIDNLVKETAGDTE